MDFFKYKHALKYSWNHKRGDMRRVLARLDRVYAFSCLQGQVDGHISNYKILSDCCHLDQLPGGRYKMNCTFLQNQEVVK
jgi:hypothetical protein